MSVRSILFWWRGHGARLCVVCANNAREPKPPHIRPRAHTHRHVRLLTLPGVRACRDRVLELSSFTAGDRRARHGGGQSTRRGPASTKSTPSQQSPRQRAPAEAPVASMPRSACLAGLWEASLRCLDPSALGAVDGHPARARRRNAPLPSILPRTHVAVCKRYGVPVCRILWIRSTIAGRTSVARLRARWDAVSLDQRSEQGAQHRRLDETIGPSLSIRDPTKPPNRRGRWGSCLTLCRSCFCVSLSQAATVACSLGQQEWRATVSPSRC